MGNPNANIYERLVRMDEDFHIQPWLAESWDLIPPNTWRFRLRDDVTFHDGTPLTATDVAWTFDRIARAGGRAISAAEGATVIDAHTVDYTPSKPNLKVPLQVVHPVFGIMKAASDPVKAPDGTGPFRFASYSFKESLSSPASTSTGTRPTGPRPAGSPGGSCPTPPPGCWRSSRRRRRDHRRGPGVGRSTEIEGPPRRPVAGRCRLAIQINGPGEYALTGDLVIRRAVAMSIDRKAIVDQVLEGKLRAWSQPGAAGHPGRGPG